MLLERHITYLDVPNVAIAQCIKCYFTHAIRAEIQLLLYCVGHLEWFSQQTITLIEI